MRCTNHTDVRKFLVYVAIGIPVFAADALTMLGMLNLDVRREYAVVAGFFVGMVVQFSLNRWLNFRAFHKSVHQQIPAYLLVTGVNLVGTVAIVDASVIALHATAFVGKICSLGFTLPFSYWGHSRVTFRSDDNAGLQAARRWHNLVE